MSSFNFLVSFFLVFFPVSVTCQKLAYCRYPLSCGVGEPEIHFPFALDGRQSKSCGDSGYDLSCNSSNRTVLQLPYSEQFFVQDINYTSQEMQIYDPDNCLVRRLLKLQIPLLFPYKLAGSNQNYTILNCSSSVHVTNISSLYAPISCMSSSANTILATYDSNPNFPFNSSCEMIATVSAPVIRTVDGLSYKISDVLLLKWQLLPDRSPGTKMTEIVYALLGLCFALVLILAFTCCICPWVIGLFRDHHRNLFLSEGILMQSRDTNQESIINIRTSLDDETIKSYQRMLLDEKLQLPNPNDTTCSICLSEYRPTETLKIIPPCNHYFHAKCIDPWLRMHTTCPVCRKSLQHSVLLPAVGAC